MENPRIAGIRMHLCYSLFLILLYVLQTTPYLFEINKVKPILVFAGSVAIALSEGPFLGGLYGVVGGLLCDMVSFSLFGFNALFLGIICIFVGLIVKHLMQPTLPAYLLYILTTVIVVLNIEFLFTYGIWRLEGMEQMYLRQVMGTTIYTVVASPFVYLFCRKIYKRFHQSSPKRARTVL